MLEDLTGGRRGVIALAIGPQGAPDGFILLQVAAGEAEILTLAVDPDQRRAGRGQSLIQAALKAAQAAGADAMFLEVAVDNDAAIALYGCAGFVQTGIRRGYYARPGDVRVDALILRRDLTA